MGHWDYVYSFATVTQLKRQFYCIHCKKHVTCRNNVQRYCLACKKRFKITKDQEVKEDQAEQKKRKKSRR